MAHFSSRSRIAVFLIYLGFSWFPPVSRLAARLLQNGPIHAKAQGLAYMLLGVVIHIRCLSPTRVIVCWLCYSNLKHVATSVFNKALKSDENYRSRAEGCTCLGEQSDIKHLPYRFGS